MLHRLPKRPISVRKNDLGQRIMPIETAIEWAWREELPKAPKVASGPDGYHLAWAKAAEFGEYLSLVDKFGVNRFGVVPDFSADRWPSADALALADAVAVLDEMTLAMPENWDPAPELGGFAGLGSKAVSEAWRRMTRCGRDGGERLIVKPSDLIIRNAIMGAPDGWQLDAVEEKVVCGEKGQPRWFRQVVQDVVIGTNPDGSDRVEPRTIEVAGTGKNNRPLPDAYRKRYLDPDPVGAIIVRAEREIWASALAMVFEDLAGKLETIELLPPGVVARPWEDHESERAPRIVEDLAARRAARLEYGVALARRFPRWFADTYGKAKTAS